MVAVAGLSAAGQGNVSYGFFATFYLTLSFFTVFSVIYDWMILKLTKRETRVLVLLTDSEIEL